MVAGVSVDPALDGSTNTDTWPDGVGPESEKEKAC